MKTFKLLRANLWGNIVFLFLYVCSLAAADGLVPEMDINLNEAGTKVSPSFYGLMTEEINHSYDGGIYAELIQNRSFKDDATTPVHWSLVSSGGGGSISLDDSQGINSALTTCIRLEATNATSKKTGIANDGFWGIPAIPKTTYRATFYAKANSDPGGALTVSIESADGKNVYAKAQISGVSSKWKRFAVELTTKDINPDGQARFVISTIKSGTYWFNCVSLFPPTWNKRANGNRMDLMQHLVDLKPKFLRFPGGNYLEGETVETRFQWKQTLGEITNRPGHMGTWSYRSSDGMGLLEFLEWAEDIHAEPVLAIYAGYSLPSEKHKNGITIKERQDLEPFVQEALDEIEYVTGDLKTKWGAQRARDGHPAPFSLHYVEIGNEDFVGNARDSYELRFAQFFDAIKKIHPQLQCIATIPIKDRTPDAIDDHYYATSMEMMKLAHKYDHYDRSKPKIFVGEWATREITKQDAEGSFSYEWMPWSYKASPTPDLHAALGDAAFMTGMERNSDVIIMNCYAPLLARIEPGAFQWNPNLIGYDSLKCYLSPSYHAQKMFNDYRGDALVEVVMKTDPKNFFYSATVERNKGKIYLKVVNLKAFSEDVRIVIRGVKKISPKGNLIVLGSSNPSDTNTPENPSKVVPISNKIDGIVSSFMQKFPPFSISVLELNVEMN